MKKYNFCCNDESELKRWMNGMKKSIGKAPKISNVLPNPMHTPVDNMRPSEFTRPSMRAGPQPEGKFGYMKKKSPAMFSGWQKRFFVLKEPGELSYYLNEEEFKNSTEAPKGSINVAEILPFPTGIEIVNDKQIKIRIGTRLYELEAENKSEAKAWVDSIDSWILYCTSND